MKQDNNIASIDWRRVLLLVGTLSLVVIYLILWMRMIASPAERTGTDFISYYAVGRIAQADGISKAYDIAQQRRIQAETVGFPLDEGQVLLYLHMPYLIPVLQLLVSGDYVASFLRWTVLSLLVYAAGLAVFLCWFPEAQRTGSRWYLAGAATFFPLFVSILLGQDTALLFLGAALLGWGLLCKRDWLAGVGLALLTVRPHFAILLALPILISRRKAFAWFLLFAGILATLSVVLLGPQGVEDFVSILRLSASGAWYGIKEEMMLNLIGLLFRWTPFLGSTAIHALGWAAYAGVLLGLTVWAARGAELNQRFLGMAFLACVLVAPHLHYHDLTMLLFPLLAIQLQTEDTPVLQGLQNILQPLAVSFILLIGSFNATINFALPYAIMLGAAVLLYRQKAGLIMNITRE